MVQAQFGVHLLKPSILILQLLQAFDIRRFHATVFGLPVVVGGIRDSIFSADFLHQSTGFDFLQNLDDLRLRIT